MKKYIGNLGKISLRSKMIKHNVGLFMTIWRNPQAWPYFAVDNGAYSAYVTGKNWNEKNLLHIISKCDELNIMPDFIVAPDIVAGGIESLQHSINWINKLPKHFPYYLAVQDGMNAEDVDPHIHRFAGIFVGGSMDWKIKNAPTWCEYAKTRNIGCHIGRIGTWPKIMWAEKIGATSIDSTTWAQSKRGSRHIEYSEMQQTLHNYGR